VGKATRGLPKKNPDQNSKPNVFNPSEQCCMLAPMDLEELRQKIHAIEWQEQRDSDVISFALPAIDQALPQHGLVAGAVHEWVCLHPETTIGLVTWLLARIVKTRGPILWCSAKPLYTLGTQNFGLAPEDILFVEVESEKEALWALEEGLQSKALGAVVGEGVSTQMATSKRLQLAAQQSGVSAFLLLEPKNRSAPISSALTRWRISPLPSTVAPGREKDNAIGNPRFHVELLRSRGGAAPLNWEVAFDTATLSLHLDAETAEKTPSLKPLT